jgi:ATP-dependent Clp protease ATP-binding subunit ClpC
VLELSMEEASQLGHNYIGTEHLLLGLIKENEGIAAQVLMNLGVKLEDVREEVLEFLGATRRAAKTWTRPIDRAVRRAATSKSKTPALDTFGRDLPSSPRRQARPGHRPRARDRARHPDPLPPHQEQPGAAR